VWACAISTDNRYEGGRFLVSVSCVTISNPHLLSSSETGVNPGIRSWKKHLSEWARCQKATGGIYFTKKWWAETLQPGLEFDNFKPRLKSGTVSSNASLGWTFRFFGGDDLGFLKEGVKTYLWHQSCLLNGQHFSVLTSIVYGDIWVDYLRLRDPRRFLMQLPSPRSPSRHIAYLLSSLLGNFRSWAVCVRARVGIDNAFWCPVKNDRAVAWSVSRWDNCERAF
jgi:hypothetical protein